MSLRKSVIVGVEPKSASIRLHSKRTCQPSTHTLPDFCTFEMCGTQRTQDTNDNIYDGPYALLNCISPAVYAYNILASLDGAALGQDVFVMGTSTISNSQ
jgi:hypothetical protein